MRETSAGWTKTDGEVLQSLDFSPESVQVIRKCARQEHVFLELPAWKIKDEFGCAFGQQEVGGLTVHHFRRTPHYKAYCPNMCDRR